MKGHHEHLGATGPVVRNAMPVEVHVPGTPVESFQKKLKTYLIACATHHCVIQCSMPPHTYINAYPHRRELRIWILEAELKIRHTYKQTPPICLSKQPKTYIQTIWFTSEALLRLTWLRSWTCRADVFPGASQGTLWRRWCRTSRRTTASQVHPCWSAAESLAPTVTDKEFWSGSGWQLGPISLPLYFTCIHLHAAGSPFPIDSPCRP